MEKVKMEEVKRKRGRPKLDAHITEEYPTHSKAPRCLDFSCWTSPPFGFPAGQPPPPAWCIRFERPVEITVAGELPGFEYGGCRGVFLNLGLDVEMDGVLQGPPLPPPLP